VSEGPRLLANIGRQERRKRLLWGLAATAAGLGLEAARVAAAASPWWRLASFATLWVGALGLMQASGHT
jgi:hypothetical protein